MSSRTLLVGILLFAFAPALPAQQPAAKKLNVLFIVVDDLNTGIGCYGDTIIKTPHLEKFAKRSVMFQRAYCQYPLCNPSRTSFLSGKRPGTPDKVLAKTLFLPNYFRGLGYAVLSVGKVAHGFGPSADNTKWDIDERPGKAPPGNTEEERTSDSLTARRAIELLKQNKERPFFLGVGIVRPHSGHPMPAKLLEKFSLDNIQLAKEREPADHIKDIPPIALDNNYKQLPAGKVPDDKQRKMIRYYRSCCVYIDELIGSLVSAVDELGLADNTVIVIVGDHGYHLGEHGLFEKQSLFEESARVPLLVRAPGKKQGATSPRIVELVDLYPTLVDLCGLPAPSHLDGKSIVPLLEQPDRAWGRVAHTRALHAKVMGLSVRNERFRYIEWGGDPQQAQLYDHDNDPREYVNLARDPRFADKVKELRKLLK